MSEFRRRLLAKKDDGELGNNDILVSYNVTSTSTAIKLIGNGFDINNIKQMSINGFSITPVKTYTFDATGEMQVKIKLNKDITNLTGLFTETNIYKVLYLHCESATNATKLFFNSRSLTLIENMYIPNVVNAAQICYACTKLTSMSDIPDKVVNFSASFGGVQINNFPTINTSNTTDFSLTFTQAAIYTLPLIDMTNAKYASNMFSLTKTLQNAGGFKNLKIDLSLSDSKNLTALSVHNIINEALGGFTLTLNATAKTRWQNSEYFYSDYLMLKEKNITISGLTITTINIPEGVTTIPDNAFSELTSLTSVTIPEGVNTIGNNAFANCTSLTSITIPSTVTHIGNNTFSGCVNVSTISMNPTTAPTLGENVWGDNVENYVGSNISDVKRVIINDAYIGYDTEKWNVLFNECGFTKVNYVSIEYLQSDSSAYIDTGISGGNDELEINCIFEVNKYVQYGAVYGNYIDVGHNMTRLVYGNSNTHFYDCMNTLTTRVAIDLYIEALSKKTNYYSSKTKAVVNGNTTYRQVFNKGIENNTNIALFNRNVTNPAVRDIGLKIYSFQISKNGKILRDFEPVRVDNVGYMYDKVSGQLFGSIGTGQFILGTDL